MVRKRHYSEVQPWPDRLQVLSTCLENMSREQDSGASYYGSCVYEDALQVKRSATLISGARYAPLGHTRQQLPFSRLQYIPPQPERVTITPQETERIISGMTTEVTISPAEARLVSEAQSLGWSWLRIAKVLRGRTAKQLMRICAQSSRPRRAPVKRETMTREDPRIQSRAPTETISLPLPAPTLLESGTVPTKVKEDTPPEKESNNPVATTTRATASTSVPEKQEEVVNSNALNRSGGDHRVTFKNRLESTPDGFTGIVAHGLESVDNIQFFEEVEVVDPDDRSRVFKFSLKDSSHCAYFNVGEGADGSPLMSWADLFCFYQLPNGTKWVEHGYLYDVEDLENYAKKVGKSCKHLIPSDMGEQELIKKSGRYHSRVQNIEYECWIYPGSLPRSHGHGEDAYYYRIAFEPVTLMRVK